jgi:pimeloyl-ACP methyl ester carboxylesterase
MSSFDDPSREPDVAARRMSRIVRYLDNDGTMLAFETRGIGRRTLLFAHGWISSRRMFYDVVGRLDPTEFTSHLLDFRGCGLSDRPSRGFDVAGYASDLRTAILDVEGPVTVIAHSMGGKIAQYVALDPPQNLQAMVLIAPGSARALPQNERQRVLARETFGSRARIEAFTRAAMIRDIAPDSLERLIDDALTASHEAWFTWHDVGRLEDFSDRIASIRLRTLVIAGERDPLVPGDRLRRDVASPIAGAAFETIPNVGHNMPVEAPSELVSLIETFARDRGSSTTRSR